jgi:anti-sigma28 factor (negative regulator of flagellin synthesis)
VIQQKAPLHKAENPKAAEVTELSHYVRKRKLMELMRDIPDTRQDRIEAVKKQIKSGVYVVPYESVARSIMTLHSSLKW